MLTVSLTRGYITVLHKGLGFGYSYLRRKPRDNGEGDMDAKLPEKKTATAKVTPKKTATKESVPLERSAPSNKGVVTKKTDLDSYTSLPKTGKLTESKKPAHDGVAILSKDQKPGKPLPPATIRALGELKAGKLNRSADADEMYRELGIKVVKTKA
jgi:hypothetical protein